MKRTLLLCLLTAVSLAGQVPITAIQGTDLVKDSRAVINSNFTALKTAVDALQLNIAVSSINPVATACDAATERGRIHVTTTDPTSVDRVYWLCSQTGATTFAWERLSTFRQTTAPAACAVGDTWFDTNATAGQNWYGCTSTDTWTLLGGGGVWGSITGTLSGQTDLQAALDAKVAGTRQIICATGLSGCGNLTADRTLALDPNALAEKTAPVSGTDMIPIYDVAGAATKKAKWPSPGGNGLQPALDTGTDTLSLACPSGQRCVYKFGNYTSRDKTATTVSIVPATAASLHTAYLWIDSAGTIVLQALTGTTFGTCSGATCPTAAAPGFPVDGSATPIAEVQINASGNFVASSLVDWRETGGNGGYKFVAASGATVAQSSDNTVTIGATSVYDYMDFSKFRYTQVFASYTTTGENWNFANCIGGGAGYRLSAVGEPRGLGWVGSGGPCQVYLFENSDTGPVDFLSGATPKASTTRFRFAREVAGYDYYLYWGNALGFANGSGVRWNNGSSVWQCVVRSTGADSGTPVTIPGCSATLGADLTFTITTSGSANNLSCSCDAGASVSPTGVTIPTITNGLRFIWESNHVLGGFTTGEWRTEISGIVR